MDSPVAACWQARWAVPIDLLKQKDRRAMTDFPSDSPVPTNEVEVLKRQLLDAQRMSALGELVGTTTHEFNNVLMSVINYAKMGLRNRDEQTRDKAFQRILAAGERAAAVTQTILAMARNRSDDFEPNDLPKLVSDALVLLERELNKYRVSIVFHADEVPRVMANGNQILQIILNLLINARQAMPDGGEVQIHITRDPQEPFVKLRVRDTGCGIPQDKLYRIFEPYFSTKQGPDASGKGGTGLGLSSCRQIIAAHRGRIRVESAVGKGTAFTIRLPIAEEVRPLLDSRSVDAIAPV